MSGGFFGSAEGVGRVGLDDRFAEALLYAWQRHRQQWRKVGNVPFLAHLLNVAGLVLDYGGDQEEAIAALLHDAAEDQGGLATLEEIRQRFGGRVADIVEMCTDTFEHPKPPWRQRKEQFLARLPAASPSVRLVCAADKIHNLRSLLRAYPSYGEQIWSFFRGGREGTLWYFRSIVQILRQGPWLPIVRELEKLLSELEALLQLPDASAAH